MSGFLGLLELKKDATVGLDGQTIVLRTDDFVGISGLDCGFHLASVRSHPKSSISVGFIVAGSDAPLVRKYDPQTEEISSEPVDSLTAGNLLEQVRAGQLPQTSVIDCSKIVSAEQKEKWSNQTKFILGSGILDKRCITHGDKIIPGSYQDDDVADLSHATPNVDGKAMVYPSIPVVDTTISLRTNKHAGTKRHLSFLTPSERTELFLEPTIASRLLRDVLVMHYDSSWKALLGDLQLAYCLFLYLQCLASLEHWKDLVAMLSLVEPKGMQAYPELYQTLVEVMPFQLASMDKGFLEDVDEAGNNFLLPALKTLCQHLSNANVVQEQVMLQFERMLSNKFPSLLVVDERTEEADDYEERIQGRPFDRLGMHDDDHVDNDSNGPVVIDAADIEASLARTSDSGVNSKSTLPLEVQERYPMLVAAILPHEDILMTCARALDEKNNVSLVRQAASYLEEVEQKRI